MNDGKIKDLFRNRDQSAIKETEQKYGKYCFATAMRILNNNCDAEECVNDAYLAVWNRIPPEDPDDLGAFVSKITRNIAVSRIREETSEKRGGGCRHQLLSELDECCGSAEDAVMQKELSAALKRFIKRLPKRDRDVFLCRYYLAYPVDEIAESCGCGEDYVYTILARARKKLRAMFEKEGLL